MLRFCRPQFRIKMIRQIIACGSPNFLNNIAGRITSILINRILVRLGGETAVSVYGVLMYVDGFVQPIMYGLCDSLQPAVGYNWGAGSYSRVRAIEKCCFTAGGVVSLLAVIVIALFPAQITKLFVNDITPENLKLFVDALRLFCLTYIVRWFSFATQSYMLAIEKPMPGVSDFGFDRTRFSRASHRRPLAARPYRHLAEFRRNRLPRRRLILVCASQAAP